MKMADKKFYSLPELPYAYNALAPQMSEEQLKIHHQKHHQAYVTGANALLEKMDKARKEKTDFDVKSALKELSWNLGGHKLHSFFWKNLAPAGKGGGGKPSGKLAEAIEQEFGSFERFKDEFSKAANSVEGSGWAALTYCRETGRPFIMQIEKHNNNVFPSFRILMVIDVFEHAYYIDYKNLRAKFVEAFWEIVNWPQVEKKFNSIIATK
jgi:superoxide dismutase, Fe-Mn family